MTGPIIMKFGGTSVGSADRIRTVAGIVAKAKKQRNVVVVISAMSSVTNTLVSAGRHAAGKNMAGLNRDFKHLQTIHLEAISGLRLDDAAAAGLRTTVEAHLAHLRKLLDSILELGELTPRAHDLIVSFGERISVRLLAQALTAIGVPADPIDAGALIVTSDTFGNAAPHLEESQRQARPIIQELFKKGRIPVVTGYMGATAGGITTTLGRGASDYSATILGYCLDAAAVEIWTDVDGVMTADPKMVSDAHTIGALSYNEAAELSYFGANVLHPLTMVPAARKMIPIWIKNTFNPTHPGTKISGQIHASEYGGKAISILKNVSLITVQGKGMLGVPGVAGRVFGEVARADINVLFISQASSEFNISFIVMHQDGGKAVKILQKAFHQNLTENTIEAVAIQESLAIVAVVGEGMKGHFGVAGRIFTALGDAQINIMAIAQGSSERNISLVISMDDVSEAAQSTHRAFKMGKAKVSL
ncbi:MAG: aspartate kinase, monofunctional class [Patescibacteria group bacterium]|nr:aspartate kinase, monofunctional class [Patescibacteria group bacterium]